MAIKSRGVIMYNRKILATSLTVGLCTLTAFSIGTGKNASATAVQYVGDVNNDGFVNAVDATNVLVEYAQTSTGGDSTFSDLQKTLADIDKSGIIDAVDATYILSYYAYVSTGGELDIEKWKESQNTDVTTTTTTVTTTTGTTTTSDTSQTTTSVTTSSDTVTTVTTATSETSPIVSDIRLTRYEIDILVGGKDISYVIMSPEDAPNKDEIWTTSDEKIAVVDQWGNVTGVSAGTCTITVTSVDNPKVKADIKVTVTDPNKISEIKLTKTEMNISVGGKDISYVTMLPESVSNKDEIWTSSDEKIASVDQWGNVTGVSAGTCTVTVTSADNPEVKADIKVTVTKDSSATFQQINGCTYINGILIANKSYCLPPSYDPKMNPVVVKQFNLLSDSASKEGLNIYSSSDYRSYSEQSAIYNNYVSWYGKATADTFSARPGHSEHQTGLAIDVNTIDDSFADTPEAVWLANHAHEYGFIIRYPKGKESITGYKYEPWHIRYLGVEKATDVYNSGLTLEEYLGIDSYYH